MIWTSEKQEPVMDITENDLNKPVIYQIKVRGWLRGKWADWFNGRIVTIHNPGDGSNETTIDVFVPDQAALRGILNKLWDLNLTLISVDTYQDEVRVGGTDEQ
jgi:hypothetical protein